MFHQSRLSAACAQSSDLQSRLIRMLNNLPYTVPNIWTISQFFGKFPKNVDNSLFEVDDFPIKWTISQKSGKGFGISQNFDRFWYCHQCCLSKIYLRSICMKVCVACSYFIAVLNLLSNLFYLDVLFFSIHIYLPNRTGW